MTTRRHPVLATAPAELDELEALASDQAIEFEVERRSSEESELAAPKSRKGGFHSHVLIGEVGPCTRCGWVWTPSAPSVRTGEPPLACSNCRSTYWQIVPTQPHARKPGDGEHKLRRDSVENRRKRRQLKALRRMAAKLNVEIIGEPPSQKRVAEPVVIPPAVDITERHAWQSSTSTERRASVIPPPPGMDDSEGI